MCMMNSPEAPPPPPPPPSAPPVLEQEAPKLSGADESGTTLDRRSKGMKSYKISKRNNMTKDTNKLGGMVQQNNTNS